MLYIPSMDANKFPYIAGPQLRRRFHIPCHWPLNFAAPTYLDRRTTDPFSILPPKSSVRTFMDGARVWWLLLMLENKYMVFSAPYGHRHGARATICYMLFAFQFLHSQSPFSCVNQFPIKYLANPDFFRRRRLKHVGSAAAPSGHQNLVALAYLNSEFHLELGNWTFCLKYSAN